MVKQKIEANVLEQENVLLRQKIAELEAKSKVEFENVLGDRISNEIRRIKQKGNSKIDRIEVIEKIDHKNVTLWTKWGDQIGPLHPDNAIQALHRFASIGVILSSDKPTGEQVQEFYKSPEGQKYLKAEKEKREVKNKSRRSGQMEKLCQEIAKMQGTTVEAINRILQPQEVKK